MSTARRPMPGARCQRPPRRLAWFVRPLLMAGLACALLLVACAGDSDDGGDPTGGDLGHEEPDLGEADPDLGEADPDLGEADPDLGTDPVACDEDPAELQRPAGWQRASHCKGVAPNYDLLFDDTVVRRMDIVVSPEDYQATMEDLDAKLSGGGGGGLNFDNPIYVPVTLSYDGRTWWHVGMRYKGNSSLKSSWTSGVRKLAFRFNFDKFEDDHPELDDQRFWGFKKMTFSNAFKDSSLIRDKLAADIFRAAGVPAARGAFVRVYLDYGEGPVYLGLYTMIEDPSDELLDVQFGDDSGNLYKPEADFTRFVEADFVKKTNEDEADFSDVMEAIEALHAARDDAATWRAGLETHFDVQAFLRCLAVNQAMVNWDSYGFMAHNYYVYASPAHDGRLVWFPWDLNEAMLVPRRLPGGGDATSVMLDEVGDDWPLIRYLLDDPQYRQQYRGYLQETLDGAFAVDRVQELMQRYHDLISPYVVGPEATEERPYTHLRNADSFLEALDVGSDALLPHVPARHTAVQEALAQ